MTDILRPLLLLFLMVPGWSGEPAQVRTCLAELVNKQLAREVAGIVGSSPVLPDEPSTAPIDLPVVWSPADLPTRRGSGLIVIFGEGNMSRMVMDQWRKGARAGGYGLITLEDLTDYDRSEQWQMAAVLAVLNHVTNHWPVDPTRVYLAGTRKGGVLASRLAVWRDLPIAGLITLRGIDEAPKAPVKRLQGLPFVTYGLDDDSPLHWPRVPGWDGKGPIMESFRLPKGKAATAEDLASPALVRALTWLEGQSDRKAQALAAATAKDPFATWTQLTKAKRLARAPAVIAEIDAVVAAAQPTVAKLLSSRAESAIAGKSLDALVELSALTPHPALDGIEAALVAHAQNWVTVLKGDTKAKIAKLGPMRNDYPAGPARQVIADALHPLLMEQIAALKALKTPRERAAAWESLLKVAPGAPAFDDQIQNIKADRLQASR